MKTKILINTILAVFILNGCSDQNDIQVTNHKTKTTPMIISASREVTTSTKTEYEDSNPNELVVKWKNDKSDKIGLFATNGATSNSLFTIIGDVTKDGKVANFSGNIEVADPNAAINVYGYYPYSASATSKNAININLSSQEQTGVNTTNHLAVNDFMAVIPTTYKKAVEMEVDAIPLSFRPLLTIMSFEITNPSSAAMDVQSIRLEAAGGETPFYTSGGVDISDNAFPFTHSGSTPTNSVELSVADGVIKGGDKGRFNMMIFPLTDKVPSQFKVIIKTGNNSYVQTKSAPSKGFMRGKRYIMAVDDPMESVGVTSVTLNKKTTSISFGATETLVATIAPSNATNKGIIWSSDNVAVATVSASGEVTAMDIGTANIIATTVNGGFKSTCEVSVINSTGRTIIRNNTALGIALYNGGKYILANNITFDNGGSIPNNINVDLDLNGYIIDGRSVYSLITVDDDGVLTICDNSPQKTGVIKNNITETSSSEYPCCTIYFSGDNAELKLLSGKIASNVNAICMIEKYPYNYHAKFTMDGGKVEGRVRLRHGAALINDGELTDGITFGAYDASGTGSGHLTLNGGKISGGIECNGDSKVIINKGEVSCQSSSPSGTVRALYLSKNCSLTINGGVISATGNYVEAISMDDGYYSSYADFTIDINGGTVIAKGISNRSIVKALVISVGYQNTSGDAGRCDFKMTGGELNADNPSGIGLVMEKRSDVATLYATIKAGTIKGGNVAVSGIFPQISTGSSILSGGFLEKTVTIGPSN